MRAFAIAAVLASLLTSTAALAQASPSPFTNATRYDLMGRVTGTISADPDTVGTGNPFLAVRTTYDAAGRPIKVETGTLSAWQSEAVAPAGWTGFTVQQSVATLYDSMGRKVRDTLREGAAGTIRTVTQYSYDTVGRLECTTVRMNPALFGSLPASACNLSTPQHVDYGPDRISRNFYDAAGQRLMLREGMATGYEGIEAAWTYNLNGQVTMVIDGNGNRAELRYDGHGRQRCWLFPSTTRPAAFNDATYATTLATAGNVNGNCVNTGDFELYEYDPSGNRTSLRKRDGSLLNYQYDALNRTSVKVVPDRLDLNAIYERDVFYAYDLRGLQTAGMFDSLTGEGVTTAHDGFGRQISSSTNMGGTARTFAYQYDRNGNRTRITHPDAQYFAYEYDGLNRLSMIRDPGSVQVAAASYDAPGRPSTLMFAAGIGTTLTYDGVSRLSTLTHNLFGTAQDVSWTYTRNPGSQLATAARTNDAYAWTAYYAVNRPYTTDGLNRYSAAGQAMFGYDTNGNLTSDGTNTYTYDIENRLIGMNGVLTLTYDPLGRLYQTAGGPSGTSRYLYDGDALVAVYNTAGALQRRFVHGNGADVPFVWYEGATLATRRHLHADQQGSIVAVGQPSAGTFAINAYDENGIPAAANEGLFQYTGQVWLDDLGMYHYKARVYSPTLGRFLQTDPVGYDDQYNLYAYVGNDPVNATDPSGQQTVWEMQGEEEEFDRSLQGMTSDEIRDAILDRARMQLIATAAAVTLLTPGPEEMLLASWLGRAFVVRPIAATLAVSSVGRAIAQGGRLVLYSRRAPPTNLSPGDIMLNMRAGTWTLQANDRIIAEAIRQGRPIRDSFVTSSGRLRRPDPGSVLARERRQLQAAGWRYRQRTQEWKPDLPTTGTRIRH